MSNNEHQQKPLTDSLINNTSPVVDSQFISSWLDQHPQFLTDYLRKMQLQRRHTIMSDHTGQLLANLYSNLRLQPHSVTCDTPLQNPTSLNLNQTTTQKHDSTSSRIFKEVENLFNDEFNDSVVVVVGDDQLKDEMSYQTRKQFKELGLYEKMYALVKTLYQSLDLKTTCKKILKTVSLLLDADR
jgi:hypothetical protein